MNLTTHFGDWLSQDVNIRGLLVVFKGRDGEYRTYQRPISFARFIVNLSKKHGINFPMIKSYSEGVAGYLLLYYRYRSSVYRGGWDFRYHGTSLLQTWGRSGYPRISILPHFPSLHIVHSDLRHGVGKGLNFSEDLREKKLNNMCLIELS